MITIDARGKVCPVPVIETKKVLRTAEGKEGATVLVDNLIATQNLSKMAAQMKLSSEVKKIAENDYEVVIGKAGADGAEAAVKPAAQGILDESGSYVVAIGSDKMGDGDEVLGKKLIGSFLYALTEQDVLPDKIVFYNSGVFLTVEGSACLEDLNKLRDLGTEILSCGLCLNFYELTEKLAVGEVTNMYRIAEIIRSNKTVRP